jgi:hypothetical protein
VQRYLEVMRLRLGERLRARVDIPPAAADAMLPPGVLLTLVENAIEHGVLPSLSGAELSVQARVEGDMLTIEVSDTGPGLAADAGDGVGLANSRTRLRQACGEAATLTLHDRRRARITVRIRIAPRRPGPCRFAPPTASEPMNQLTALIADDEEGLAPSCAPLAPGPNCRWWPIASTASMPGRLPSTNRGVSRHPHAGPVGHRRNSASTAAAVFVTAWRPRAGRLDAGAVDYVPAGRAERLACTRRVWARLAAPQPQAGWPTCWPRWPAR